jgi:hypothetical protein
MTCADRRQFVLQRFRQSMRRPMMRTVVARQRAAWRCGVGGRCCGAAGRSSTTTCWWPRRSNATPAAAVGFDARELGAAPSDLELVDAVVAESVAHGAGVVAPIEMERADVGEQAGIADGDEPDQNAAEAQPIRHARPVTAQRVGPIR